MAYKYTNASGRKMYDKIDKTTIDDLIKKNHKLLKNLPDMGEYRIPNTPQQTLNAFAKGLELLTDPDSTIKTIAGVTRALQKPSTWFVKQTYRNWGNYFETPEESQEFSRYIKDVYDYLKDIIEQRLWNAGYTGEGNTQFIIYTLKTYFGRSETINTINLEGEMNDEGQVKPRIRGVDGNDLLIE